MLRWISTLLRRAAVQHAPGAGEALVHIAEAWLEQGIRETEGSNAGPDVSWLIHDGGGTPDKRPPWCAYFVASCCRQLARAGFHVEYTRTGRAVSHWQKASTARQLLPLEVWQQDARGLVMVRTRLSEDVTDVERARKGKRRMGHVGIVTEINTEKRTVSLVAGNSSGYGHERISGSGAVARETVTEGDPAWSRIVGFVRVCQP
mgnify:CR=1 FL=1